MDISDIIKASNTGSTSNKDDKTKFGNDYNQFLRLLTTQLKNQDPLSPMDSSEFTNQIVQFANVEQNIKSNDYLQKLLTLNSISLTGIGLSYVGLDVFAPGIDFVHDGKSPQPLSYRMPENAKVGTVAIINDEGETVFSAPADIKPGIHNLSWDGKDNDGHAVPAGNYFIKVSAQSTDGKPLNVTTFTSGTVTGIETAEDGSVSVIINGKLVPVTEIRQASLRAYVKPPADTPPDEDTPDNDTNSGTTIAA